METPRTPKDKGKPVICRALVTSPCKMKQAKFTSTQIVQYNFTAIQWLSEPITTTDITRPARSRPFIFRGSAKNVLHVPTVQLRHDQYHVPKVQSKRGSVNSSSMNSHNEGNYYPS